MNVSARKPRKSLAFRRSRGGGTRDAEGASVSLSSRCESDKECTTVCHSALWVRVIVHHSALGVRVIKKKKTKLRVEGTSQ